MKIFKRLIVPLICVAVIIYFCIAGSSKVTGEIVFATENYGKSEAFDIYVYSVSTGNVERLSPDGYCDLRFAAKGDNDCFYCVGNSENGDVNALKVNSDNLIEKSIKVEAIPDRMEGFLNGVLLVFNGRLVYLDFKTEELNLISEEIDKVDDEYQICATNSKAIFCSNGDYFLLQEDNLSNFSLSEIENCAITSNSCLVDFYGSDRLFFIGEDYNDYIYNVSDNKVKKAPSLISITKRSTTINGGKTIMISDIDSAFGSKLYFVDIRTGFKRAADNKVFELDDSAYDLFWREKA